MAIEDEVNTSSSTNTQSQDNVDRRFLQEQIARVFNIWSGLNRLPTVGPSSAYFQDSRSDLKELIEHGKTVLELQIHLNEYWVQINNTFLQALAKSSEKAPKQYNSKQDIENYRRVVIDVLEDAFTGLFNSKEHAILCGLVQGNQYDLLTHLQKLAENNLKVLNLPTRSEMDDLSKDIHDLKKRVHDLNRKMNPSRINESGT
ncbi:MAG: hypothetical protein DLM72_21215 [Candidatus Nitrosopolaris wilkensis]|nr:MAG: hypothetical protein DLM72_21215 [Candidatus Nitrosopolaris wilkensis]